MRRYPKETPLSKTVRNLRNWSGLTLREASKRIGISDGYLSQIETGMRHPRGATLIRDIAKVYGYNEDLLLEKVGIVQEAPFQSTVVPEKEFVNTLEMNVCEIHNRIISHDIPVKNIAQSAFEKYGHFRSNEELYGVLSEEVYELLMAIHAKDENQVRREVIDIAAVCEKFLRWGVRR